MCSRALGSDTNQEILLRAAIGFNWYKAKVRKPAYTKTPSDTIDGAIFSAPFCFEFTEFILTAKKKLMACGRLINSILQAK